MSARADAVAAVVAERELDALLVVEEFNLRWLTGYTGTNGLALVGDDLRVFLTDFRYVEQAEHEVDPGFDRRRGERDLLEDGRNALPERRPLKLGFDDANTSVRTHGRLRELLGDQVELVAAGRRDRGPARGQGRRRAHARAHRRPARRRSPPRGA